MRSFGIGLGLLAGAILVAQPAAAQTQSSPMSRQSQSSFCHVDSGSMARNCIYASMEACEKIRESQGGSCVENTGTTGSGMQNDNTRSPGSTTSPKSGTTDSPLKNK